MDPGWRKGFLSKFFLGVFVCQEREEKQTVPFLQYFASFHSRCFRDCAGCSQLAWGLTGRDRALPSFSAEALCVSPLAGGPRADLHHQSEPSRQQKVEPAKGPNEHGSPIEIIGMELFCSPYTTTHFKQVNERLCSV